MVEASNALNADGVKIDNSKTQLVTDMGYMFTALNESIPDTSGIKTWWAKSDLKTFGESAKGFIEAMVEASNALNADGVSINEEAIEKAVNAGSLMASLQEAIPTDKWFDGKVQLDDFGAKIKKFGGYLSDYSEVVSDIDTESMSTSITNANRLANLALSIVDLDTAGITNFKEISGISDTLSVYYDTIKDVDVDVLTKSITGAVRLKSLLSALADIDPSGVQNFQIVPIGTAMKSYGSSVANIDPEVVESSITSAMRIKNLINDLAGIDIGSVESFKTAVDELSNVSIDGFVKSFSGSEGKLSTSGANLIVSFINGVKSKSSSASSVISEIVTGMHKAITSKLSSFVSAGEVIITKLSNAIKSKSAAVVASFSISITLAITAIIGYRGSFASAGEYLGSGLVEGINSKQTAVYNAGYRLGQKAVQGEKDGQKSKSPSKLTIQSGKWLGEGLVIGIRSMGSKVYNAGHNLGDSAANSISSAVAKMTDFVSEGIDSTPTIRPVLDLSDVESGVGTIDGLLGGSRSMSIMSNVNSISSMMNRRNQNGANEEVVTAINKLRKDLENVGNTTYSINGITYDDGSNVSDAIKSLVRAARIERRV